MAANIVPQKVEDVDTQALSPMMQQYLEIKRQHPNEILFYRVGDFYEMFFDDALTASRELELTLTGKACGLPDRAPMCGVPFHSYEIYAARLIAKGYKVAICEQMEDPALAKGLVKRDIIRVITPGTVIESSMLADDKNNYICSIYTRKVRSRWKAGICFADISTGEAYATELTAEKMGPAIITELNPAIKNVDASCFDGIYVTGDISACDISRMQQERPKTPDEDGSATSRLTLPNADSAN